MSVIKFFLSFSNSVRSTRWCCHDLPARPEFRRINSGPDCRLPRKLASTEHRAGLARELSVLPDVDVAPATDQHVVIINPCRYSNVAFCGKVKRSQCLAASIGIISINIHTKRQHAQYHHQHILVHQTCISIMFIAIWSAIYYLVIIILS